MTSPRSRPIRSLNAIDGYLDLAEHELRKLEDVDSATTLPAAYVAARGFTAVTYAVLALRETYWDQAIDISNTLSRLADAAVDTSDYAGRITWAAEETADYTGRLAAVTVPWWRRLALRLRPLRPLQDDDGPEKP